MNDLLEPRLTPWVKRLLLSNAIVLLLMETVFRSSAIRELVWFDPALVLQHPWTIFTYMFVHAHGLLHLATNAMALFVFGPTVERRFGSSLFIFYYLLCGVGAALLSLMMWWVAPSLILPFVGASGAILGVALAFAKFVPDAEMMVFPIPVPIKARQLVMLFVVFDIVGAWLGSDNIAHFAHLGGIATGWLFFRARNLGKEPGMPRMQPLRSRAPVAVRSAPAPKLSVMSARPEPQPQKPAVDQRVVEKAEVDRVLDKILESGMGSLTSDERQILEAQRRRGGVN